MMFFHNINYKNLNVCLILAHLQVIFAALKLQLEDRFKAVQNSPFNAVQHII